MNKELLNQLPADEQHIAAEINSAAESMKLSRSFQWELETRLMNAATRKNQRARGWHTKIMPSIGWALLAGCAIFLLNWTIRSLAANPPEVGAGISDPQVSFVSDVRQGNICMGTLAVEHGFAVFLTSADKTQFVALDAGNTIGELRSFTWSADGKQLAIVGNTTGSGNIYVTDPSGGQIEYLLSSGELGYLMDAAWSRDGKQFVMWSVQNNKVVHLLNADGSGLVEKELGMQVLSTPQFAPDGKSIVFYGANATSAGLFQAILEGSQINLISAQVEDETGFAFSPDGSHLAYMEMDRNTGEARLVSQEIATGMKAIVGTLPVPKGSGSSLPESANLSWSADGKSLVFDFGRGAFDRAVYLAYADGIGLVKLVDSAYAPAISADGKCLSYISDKQVFLLDLTGVSVGSTTSAPVLLADLPAGRGTADYRLNKLQWRP